MMKFNLCLGTFLVCLIISCKEPDSGSTTPDWTDKSHGDETAPDYEQVLPQEKVNTIEIRMTASDWQAIKTDMQSKFGSDFGAGGSQTPGGEIPFDTTGMGPRPDIDTTNGNFPGNGNNGGNLNFGTDDPNYIAVSMTYGGKQWYKVGFRLKGNSSLSNAWRSGNYKLPFRLDFDEFEDQYPEIKNQRFFGFNELSFSPGYNDKSLIREKVASDIFRTAGIASAKTAFYKVYIDLGDGLKYFGVYTAVEVIDDTMVKDQFGEGSGNIYKPESTFKSFTQSEFEKKNNKTQNDYSDVQSTIATLNSNERTSNPAAWRANLEKTFNADYFVKWLAVNTAMVNWDTYGRMAHNHYLYNLTGKGLTWIPWDNNEAMSSRGTGGNGTNPDGNAGGFNQGLSLSLSEVNSSWPLIRYLIDDTAYLQRYKAYLRAFNDEVFTYSSMSALFDRYSNLISPHVIGPVAVEQTNYSHTTASAFKQDLTNLKEHVTKRNEAINTFLK